MLPTNLYRFIDLRLTKLLLTFELHQPLNKRRVPVLTTSTLLFTAMGPAGFEPSAWRTTAHILLGYIIFPCAATDS